MLSYNIISNIFYYFNNTYEKIRFLDVIFNIDDFDYAMKNWFKKYDNVSSIFDPIVSPLSGDFDYVDVLFEWKQSIYIPDDIEKLKIILKYDKRLKYNSIVQYSDSDISLFVFFRNIIDKDYKLLCKYLPDFHVIAYKFLCYTISMLGLHMPTRGGMGSIEYLDGECILFDMFNKYFETDEKYYEDFLNYVIEFWPEKPNMLNIFKYVLERYDINKRVISADNLLKTMLVNYSGEELYKTYIKDIIKYQDDVDNDNDNHILTYYDVTNNLMNITINGYIHLRNLLPILEIVVNEWNVELDKSFKKIILNKCLDYCKKLKLKDYIEDEYGLNSINYDNDMNGIFAEYQSFFKISSLFNLRF